MQTATELETKVRNILKKVLDVKDNEIIPGAKLDESLDVDSTEMVEISVAIKKELGVALKDNELKKTHSLNDIVALLASKKEGGCGSHSCGCGH